MPQPSTFLGRLFNRNRSSRDDGRNVQDKRSSVIMQNMSHQPNTSTIPSLEPLHPATGISQGLKYSYGSRSLSRQVAAVKSLFPAQDLPGPSRRGSIISESSDDCKYASPARWLSRSEAIDSSGSARSGTAAWSTTGNGKDITTPGPIYLPKRRSSNVRPHSIGAPIFSYDERRGSLTRKPDVSDLRKASDSGQARRLSLPINVLVADTSDDRRLSAIRMPLDKPLPPTPLILGRDRHASRPPSNYTLQAQNLPSDREGAPVGLHSAKCNAQVGTTVYERWYPAVTRETITRRIHEVREEQITREIHSHDVYIRELPVVDVELLPVRHFMSTDKGDVEIASNEVQEVMRPSEDWLRSQAMSQLLHKDHMETTEEWAVQQFDSLSGEAVRNDTSDMSKHFEGTTVHLPTVNRESYAAERACTIRLDSVG